MVMLKRADAPAQEDFAREVVTVEALGGDVIVIELGLDARLDFEKAMNEERAKGRAGLHAIVPHLLAAAVCIAGEEGDEPLYTAQQWRRFGVKNRGATFELFNTAVRLSGLDEGATAKN